jgi:hypothetical protein
MALKSMSIDRLTSLREKVDATLRTKITETRRDLEAKLSKLSRFGNSVAASARSVLGTVPSRPSSATRTIRAKRGPAADSSHVGWSRP